MSDYVKFQVKSTGQWLNIYGLNAPSGMKACQGDNPITPNFLWTIIDDGTGSGWCLIQVKDTGQYLNIQGGGNANATPAVQAQLPNPITDNFLWKIVPDQNNPGWSKIQVKNNTNLYLNIFVGEINGVPVDSSANGAFACQGNTPNSPNFLWMQYNNAVPKDVIVTLNLLNCTEIYKLNTGAISESDADLYLSMADDNQGHKEDTHQSSFETLLNQGSLVTWSPNIGSGSNNNGFTAAITSVTYVTGSGTNVLNSLPPNGNSAQANVLWTAIPPDTGDNEAYTINFTLNGGRGPKTYSFDPKIKINPSN